MSTRSKEVLKIKPIGITDDFFRIGGDSILSIQLSSKSRQQGIHLSVKDIFDYRTIEKLAKIDEKEYADKTGSLTNSFQLQQNYPNPFNPSTEICFNIPESGNVRLVIYNSLGQRVKTLVSKTLQAGEHRISWNSHNYAGQPVSSGVYFYRLSFGNFKEQKKMLLIR